MTGITSEPWFWWAVALVVGVPALIVALGEVQGRLARRDNALAKPIALLRNFVVPVAALLALLWLLYDGRDEQPWQFQVVATLFGFLLLLFALSSLNAAMFLNAEEDSWRRRMPRIFVDLIRLVLIVIGVAILLATVWGADVGGIFAALGVTGIVVGLALQNAVGGIISGLLLLFEQPFEIGDWLDTGSISGRVVEVNWRAVHIETGNQIHVVPNASLAGAPFANLSRPTRDYSVTVESSFAVDDVPAKIIEVLDEVAADVPRIREGGVPRTWAMGAGTYATSLPVETYADADAARATFLRRIWYATRRAGLHLDKADPAAGTGPEDVEAALRQVSSALYLSEDDIGSVATRLRLETFAPGERIHRAGTVPADVSFIIGGNVLVSLDTVNGPVDVARSEPGDYLGQTALTREPSDVTAIAESAVTLLRVPRAVMDELVTGDQRLASEVADVIDSRRQRVAELRSSGPVVDAASEAGEARRVVIW